MIVAKATEACDIPEVFQALLPHIIFPGLTTKAENVSDVFVVRKSPYVSYWKYTDKKSLLMRVSSIFVIHIIL